jgi:adenine-specific DNA-methyltransferase
MSDDVARYAAAVGNDHRRELGQFFTPMDLAAFMCRWVQVPGTREVFDPAFGLGVFARAAHSLNPGVVFHGSDVDPVVLTHCRNAAWRGPPAHVVCEDYLGHWNQEHQAIVCNPPYMRFQHFAGRDAVFARFATHLGLKLSGYTNLASAFLLKSLSELRPGGRLAYVMPLEFLNTGYGTVVKRGLLEGGHLKALIRMDAEKAVFPDATTSVGIILVAKDGVLDPVQFHTVASLDDLPRVLESPPARLVPRGDLEPGEKWLRHFDANAYQGQTGDLTPISTYGTFSRGIATGANEFFVLSPSQAREHGLPQGALLRCITKSAQVSQPVLTPAHLNALEESDAPVLLLNVSGTATGTTRKYLDHGERQGFHQRYLTKVRNPWYKLEKRAPSPLLFGVFSRDRFKVVRNHSSAINLTCFHGFYPNLIGQDVVDLLFLYFKSRTARRLLELNMRRYGGSLDKFEPNDLNRALAPSAHWFATVPRAMVAAVLDSCVRGEGLPPALEDRFDRLLVDEQQGGRNDTTS